MPRRVVITGIGLITPLGNSYLENWQNLIEGVSGIDIIRGFDISNFPVKIAGEVKGFNPENFVDKKEARKYSKVMLYSVAATKEAIENSKLDVKNEDNTRIGVVVGSGIGGLEVWEDNHTNFIHYGLKKVSPLFVPTFIINSASGAVSIEYKLKGPNLSISTACATGLHSIGEAYRMIQYNDADLIFAGGVETAITAFAMAGFARIKALSTNNDEPKKASRPFDRNRDGFVMSEGCGILLLEELEHALKRGAPIYSEIVGYGKSSDAYHITAPDPDGVGSYLCMVNAIKDAKIEPSAIDYVNAHGTATPYNDVIETKAIKKCFGEHAYKLKVSSTKSMTGHMLGATGSVEAAYTALMIKNSCIAPTINLIEQDPECDLDYVPNKAILHNISYAMTNSFGFGGTNACIILKKFV
jgi:3-oxoacyl-[acyl-carrier-protein] synthase II